MWETLIPEYKLSFFPVSLYSPVQTHACGLDLSKLSLGDLADLIAYLARTEKVIMK